MAEAEANHALAVALGGLEMPTREAFERTTQLRVPNVVLSANDAETRSSALDRSARRDLCAAARRRSLRIAGIDLWIPAGHFTDAAHADRAVAAVLAVIELAADLGQVTVSTALPDAKSVMPDAKRALARDAVRSIADHADRFGVRIADHAVHADRDDDDDDDDREQMNAIVVGIDPAAHLAKDRDPVQAVHAHAQRIGVLRLDDRNEGGDRCPIGAGSLDLLAYAVAASVAGYREPFVIDPRGWREPWMQIERSIDVWNALPLPGMA